MVPHLGVPSAMLDRANEIHSIVAICSDSRHYMSTLLVAFKKDVVVGCRQEQSYITWPNALSSPGPIAIWVFLLL